jgi:mRNA-degrading endonuclease RelE of RelBE toxin-antitoxin system
MRFIETPVFTRRVQDLWSDDDYQLQLSLIMRPTRGPIIPRSGGLRKIRWHLKGKGKRGGVRVIYYWHEPSEIFSMLFVYQKNVAGDLTAQQVRTLRQLVEEEFTE